MKYYTGIGSRSTPEEILEVMRWSANQLYFKGYTLRSGGAAGADQAFEWGVAQADQNLKLIQERTEIYLPWPGFEIENRSWIKPKLERPAKEAYEFGKKYHPGWKFLTPGGMMLHARNMHQVMGPDVYNPVYSEFIVCWTEDAKGKGGTGQALRVAKDINIPIYDLADEKRREEFVERYIL